MRHWLFCVPVCRALGCKAESPFEPDYKSRDEDGHGASAISHGQPPASNGLLPNAVDAMAISTVHQNRRAHVAQPASPHVIRPGHREVRPGCVTTPASRKSSHKKDRRFHRRLIYTSSHELDGARRNISLWSRPVRGFV
ncbi:hypothetical protein GGI42DRAFT_149194 [Trichoderma sp. SZMC 28013]